MAHIWAAITLQCFGQRIHLFNSDKCNEDFEFVNVLKPEIQLKSPIVNSIIDLLLNTNERNKTYEELAEFVDTFGGRLTGSEALENSTNYLIDKLENEKLDNVYTEDVLVPNWSRGLEWCRMIQPRYQKLSILGLAGSVSTPEKGITGQVVVINSVDQLNDISKTLLTNKISLININHVNGSYVKFKLDITRTVAEAGGLAVLFKSYAKNAIYSPYAGVIRYHSKEHQIPAASITTEDAELLTRISNRDVKVVISLHLESNFHGIKQSRNLIAELVGTQYPNEAVIVSAHLDSWDVGQGAIDDGAGVFMCWRTLALLNKLNLKPKRTLRMVLFVGTELGKFGSKAYIERHKEVLENVSLVMNTDFGAFKPYGLTFSGHNTRAQCIVNEILQLLQTINATELVIGKSYDLTQSDANEFISAGVPASGLLNDNSKYWHYSHTSADTITAIDPYFLDLSTIVWTVSSYIMADLSVKLPKD